MPPLSAVSAAPLQIQGLNESIPEIVEDEAELSKLLGDGGKKAERVSTVAFRVRMQTALPGAVKKVNLDTGVLPSGGASQWDQGVLTPLSYMLPIQYSQLAQLTGEPNDVSSLNPVTKTIADVSRQAAKYRDIFLVSGSGDGSFATVSSVVGNTITLNATPFGARLCNKGQLVQIMSSGYVLRGPCTILNVFDFLGGTQQIIVDNAPAGVVATDLVMVDGVEQGAPVFINGVPYALNTSTTGTYLGISRANPYVVANGVPAAGAQLTLPMLRIAMNQVKQRLGKKALMGQFWHMHESQIQAYEELGFNLQYIPLADGKAKGMDLLFEDFKIAGKTVYENIHADQTQAQLLIKKSWGMIKWGNSPFWFKNRGGMSVFQQYDNASGNPTVQELMFLTEAYQWYVDNVVAQGGVTGLKVPTGN